MTELNALAEHEVAPVQDENVVTIDEDAERRAEEEKIRKRQARGRRVSVSAECGTQQWTAAKRVVHPKSAGQIAQIQTAVSNNFLFSCLDQEQFSEVVDAMFEKEVNDGEVVIKQGDGGDFFYVLGEGTACVTLEGVNDGKSVLDYTSGNSFGELALMYNMPRAASVTMTSSGKLWALDRQTFRRIMVANMSKKKSTYEEFLSKCPLFEDMDHEQIAKIADVLEEHTFKKSDQKDIITQGDDDYLNMKFYLVLEGQAEVFRYVESEEAWLPCPPLIERGDFFGEKALLEKVPRAASVKCKSDILKCAALDVAAFERLMGSVKKQLVRRCSSYAEPASGGGIKAIRALSPKAKTREEAQAEKASADA